jgi:hypothetical protein
MSHKLDHLLWATPALEKGMAQLDTQTGVRPEVGGTHPGFGTRNALLSLGEGVYLEVIAPDPAQDLTDTRGKTLATLRAPKLLTFAVRTQNIGDAHQRVRAAGVKTPGPIRMSRRRPQGRDLSWQVLRLEDHTFGDAVPFFIDWGDSQHPSEVTPTGCSLLEFEVGHPQHTPLSELFKVLDIDVPVVATPEPQLYALLETPNGHIRLR